MTVSARSWATMLVLALAFSVGTATGASAQVCPGPRPGPPAPPVTFDFTFPTASFVVPGTPPPPIFTVPPAPRVPMGLGAAAAPAAPCRPGPDGVEGTADDLVVPFRADTGAGGMGEDGSMTPRLLLGGGLLALGAAFGLRRAGGRRV